MAELYDVAVLGAGPGGCTAALYAARAGLRAVVLEQLSAGGQMADAPLIENYPGFPEGVGGFELGQLMQQGAERAGGGVPPCAGHRRAAGRGRSNASRPTPARWKPAPLCLRPGPGRARWALRVRTRCAGAA